MALGEGEGDVARLLVEGNGGEDLVRDFALLIPNKGDAGEEGGGGD